MIRMRQEIIKLLKIQKATRDEFSGYQKKTEEQNQSVLNNLGELRSGLSDYEIRLKNLHEELVQVETVNTTHSNDVQELMTAIDKMKSEQTDWVNKVKQSLENLDINLGLQKEFLKELYERSNNLLQSRENYASETDKQGQELHKLEEIHQKTINDLTASLNGLQSYVGQIGRNIESLTTSTEHQLKRLDEELGDHLACIERLEEETLKIFSEQTNFVDKLADISDRLEQHKEQEESRYLPNGNKEPDEDFVIEQDGDSENGDDEEENESQLPKEESAENNRLPPIDRGGGRTSETDGKTFDTGQKEKANDSIKVRFQLVCYKNQREWNVGLEIYDGSTEGVDFIARQEETVLEEDDGFYRLIKLTGKINIQTEEGSSSEYDLFKGKEAYLLFKLVAWADRGYRVSKLSSGSYLAIVPADWQRDEATSGPAPIAPEPVFAPGYRAHFFDLSDKDADEIVAFNAANGSYVPMQGAVGQFDLIGNRISDFPSRVGPRVPPRVRGSCRIV